ncbi:hypothetical protein evm_004678 [Chilo suppressalis]|nr:hypothetical protein evm_004678 [Chilo suppressalis]
MLVFICITQTSALTGVQTTRPRRSVKSNLQDCYHVIYQLLRQNSDLQQAAVHKYLYIAKGRFILLATNLIRIRRGSHNGAIAAKHCSCDLSGRWLTDKGRH